MDAIAETRSWRHIVLAAIAIIVVVGLWLWIPGCLSNGDYAPVNALFSGLAFAGLIIAIFLQREELQLQRIELAQTRQELKGQKEQLEGQKRQMEIQNFENRFFQMLAMWSELRRFFEPRYDYHGKLGFAGLATQLRELTSVGQTIISDGKATSNLQVIEDSINLLYEKCPDTVRNYMRILYNIVKLVDRAQIGLENQKFYTNVVRAQLSQEELVVIYYNCLSDHGRVKFKPLIQTYSMLKHLNMEGLIRPERPEDDYALSAFK